MKSSLELTHTEQVKKNPNLPEIYENNFQVFIKLETLK